MRHVASAKVSGDKQRCVQARTIVKSWTRQTFFWASSLNVVRILAPASLQNLLCLSMYPCTMGDNNILLSSTAGPKESVRHSLLVHALVGDDSNICRCGDEFQHGINPLSDYACIGSYPGPPFEADGEVPAVTDSTTTCHGNYLSQDIMAFPGPEVAFTCHRSEAYLSASEASTIAIPYHVLNLCDEQNSLVHSHYQTSTGEITERLNLSTSTQLDYK
jgi:hypothetical protein